MPLIRVLAEGTKVGPIEYFVRNDNNRAGTYISAHAYPLLSRDDQEVIASVGIIHNITKRRMAEAQLKQTISELRDQNELMEATFNSIADGIIVADTTGKFLYTNPGARQILGSEITRRTGTWAEKPGNFFYLDRETPIKNEDLPLPRAIFRGESTNDEDIFIRNEERPAGFCIRVNGHPLLDADGEIQRGVITFRDVTEQLVAEEALTRAFAQGRLEIVDTILHNIGNAITSVTIGIETVSQRLASDPLLHRLLALAKAIETHREDWPDYIQNDPQGQQVLPFIIALAEDFNEESIWLTTTVNRVKDRAQHIADIVRTQKALGDSHMTRKNIEFKDGLMSAVRVLQDSLNKRSIKLDIDCENAPQNIMVQESQFHQMVVNLVKNSLEAIEELAVAGGLREPPRIQIRAYTKGDFLHLDVSDNGIGVEPKDHKLVFAAGYTTKKSGSGLGLHSTANFVIGSGGQVHMLSDGIGQGTTMRIMLRLADIAPVQEAPQEQT